MSQIELDAVAASSPPRGPSLEHLRKFEPLSDARTAVDPDTIRPTTSRQAGTPIDCNPTCVATADTSMTAVPPPDAATLDLEALSQVQSQAPIERIPTYLQPDMPVRERLNHFTFAWYTLTMSTSGIALMLGLTPNRFAGLNIIGLVIFLLDLVFFLFITVAMGFRFALHRHTFRRALTHPSESLFISTFFLSICALLANAAEYGRLFWAEGHPARDGLFRFLHVAFWLYLAVTFLLAVIQYHLLFTVKPTLRLEVSNMTPAWILPIFPAMLAGTLAAAVAPDQTAIRALPMLAAGLAAQGLGFLVSVFMYATYLSRLMAFGLPAQRPGMFIAVGPPSFTCAAFIALAEDAARVLGTSDTRALLLAAIGVDNLTLGSDSAAATAANIAANLRLTALVSAVFLWGLSFWFFALAAAASAAGMPDRRFHLSWWSFVFPNAGLTMATVRLGKAFDSSGVLWFSSAMTACLVLAWLFILVRCARAVIRREIVWPGHDEDS